MITLTNTMSGDVSYGGTNLAPGNLTVRGTPDLRIWWSWTLPAGGCGYNHVGACPVWKIEVTAMQGNRSVDLGAPNVGLGGLNTHYWTFSNYCIPYLGSPVTGAPGTNWDHLPDRLRIIVYAANGATELERKFIDIYHEQAPHNDGGVKGSSGVAWNITQQGVNGEIEVCWPSFDTTSECWRNVSGSPNGNCGGHLQTHPSLAADVWGLTGTIYSKNGAWTQTWGSASTSERFCTTTTLTGGRSTDEIDYINFGVTYSPCEHDLTFRTGNLQIGSTSLSSSSSSSSSSSPLSSSTSSSSSSSPLSSSSSSSSLSSSSAPALCKSRIYTVKAGAANNDVMGAVALERNAVGQLFHKATTNAGTNPACLYSNNSYGREHSAIFSDGTHIFTTRTVDTVHNHWYPAHEIRIEAWRPTSNGQLVPAAPWPQGIACTDRFVHDYGSHGIFVWGDGTSTWNGGDKLVCLAAGPRGWDPYGGNYTNISGGPGFQVFSFNSANGLFTYLAEADIGGNDVFVDDVGYMYVSGGTATSYGLSVLSLTSLGNTYPYWALTLEASDYRWCSCYPTNNCNCINITTGLWSDGTYIYIVGHGSSGYASAYQNLSAYTWDGTTLTHVSEIEDFTPNSLPLSIWGDGDFIYVGTQNNLKSFKFDGTSFALKDSIDTCSGCKSIFGDGDFIYVNHGDGGLHSYKADANGLLSHISYDLSTRPAAAVWDTTALGVWAGQIPALDSSVACLTESSHSSSQSPLCAPTSTPVSSSSSSSSSSSDSHSPVCCSPQSSWTSNTTFSSGFVVSNPSIIRCCSSATCDRQRELGLLRFTKESSARLVDDQQKCSPCPNPARNSAYPEAKSSARQGWIIDFDPSFDLLYGRLPLHLGKAKYNFNIVCDFIAADSSFRSSCCLPSSSSSPSSSSPSSYSPSSYSPSSYSPSSRSPSSSSSSRSSSSKSPSSSSPSSKSSISSSSSSLGKYNTYEIHPCGHYCPENCNQWVGSLGNGIDIKVPRENDVGDLLECSQPWWVNPSITITIHYKIAYINFSPNSPYRDCCYLLISKACDGPNIPELVPSLNKGFSHCSPCLSSIGSSDCASQPATTPPPTPYYKYYDVWKCGSWTGASCAQFYTYAGGTPVRILSTNDVTNLVCNQNNNTTLNWKITELTFVSGANLNDGCYLMLERGASVNATLVAQALGTHQSCTGCSALPSRSSRSSSSSVSLSSSSLSSSSAPSSSGSPSSSSSSSISLTCCLAQSSWNINTGYSSGFVVNLSLSSRCCSSQSQWVTGTAYTTNFVVYHTLSSSSLSSSSQRGSSSSSLGSLSSTLCPLFHVDDEEIRGPWTDRDPEYNRNLTITQGDTVCYRIAYFSEGSPIDLRTFGVKSYIKLNFSDVSYVERFDATLVPGTINMIEMSMTAAQTTCLPITELVYSCEVTDISNTISQNNEILKVTQGYLRVMPEVTRDDSACSVFGFGPQPSVSSSSSGSSSSSSAFCCPEFEVNRFSHVDGYIFEVQVPTEEVLFKDIAYWEVELTTNPGQANSYNEVELVQNEMDPALVSGGYDMVYPVGGGKYRFIDKTKFITEGTLRSVFINPIPKATYVNAKIRLRFFTNSGCSTEWCEMDFVDTNISKDCCPSWFSIASSSSSSSSSSLSPASSPISSSSSACCVAQSSWGSNISYSSGLVVNNPSISLSSSSSSLSSSGGGAASLSSSSSSSSPSPSGEGVASLSSSSSSSSPSPSGEGVASSSSSLGPSGSSSSNSEGGVTEGGESSSSSSSGSAGGPWGQVACCHLEPPNYSTWTCTNVDDTAVGHQYCSQNYYGGNIKLGYVCANYTCP